MAIDIPVTLGDNVTSPFENMTKSITSTIHEFERLNALMDKGLKPPNTELETTKAELTSIGAQTTQNTHAQVEYNNAVSSGESKMAGLLGKAKMLAVTYLGLRGINSLISMADGMSLTASRIDIMNNGLNQTDNMLQQIYQSAQDTRSSFGDVASVVTRLGILAPKAFKSNEELLSFVDIMNKSFKVGGAGIQEQTAAMYQLTQAMASGRLQGDEFVSIMENAPILAQAIKKELNGIDLKKASSEGLITADVIKRAMFNSADDINAKFNSLPMTFADIAQKLKNNFLVGMQPVANALRNFANTDDIKKFVDESIVAFRILGNIAAFVINSIAGAIHVLVPVLRFLSPAIYGAVAAMTALMIISAIYNVVSLASKGILLTRIADELTFAAAKIYSTGCTIAATAAQYGFNAAIMACPITWIILAVIALIAVFFILVDVFNHVTGAHVSGIGLICGAFMFLGSIVLNVGIYIMNIMGAAAEFIGNVFNHPIYSVMRLFANLLKNALKVARGITSCFDSVATNIANAFIDGANKAIGAINWIIRALNKIPGVNLSEAGKFSHTASITHAIDTKIGDIDKWLSASKPKDYKAVKPMNFIKPMDAAKMGYDFGAGLGKKLKGLSPKNAMKNLMPNMGKDLGGQGATNGLGGSGGGRGGGTGKHLKNIDRNSKRTADNTEAAISDVRYMRELAERQAINKFTTAEINIENNVTNTNPEMDLDGFVSGLTDTLQNQLEIHVDGYHKVG